MTKWRALRILEASNRNSKLSLARTAFGATILFTLLTNASGIRAQEKFPIRTIRMIKPCVKNIPLINREVGLDRAEDGCFGSV
jgi:hypothetical protein